MTRRMIIMLAGCVLLFGGIFGFKAVGEHFMNQFFDNMPEPPHTISAARAQLSQWSNTLDAVGSVVAVNGTALTTEAAGTVTEILFDSGDLVTRDTLLLRLDATTDAAELEGRRAAAELARLDLERVRQLHQQGSASQAELDRARAQYQQTGAAATAQASVLAKKTLRAPFSGQLGIRQINLGEYLTPGTAIVSLQQLDPVYIRFSVPERELAVLRAGMQVTARADALHDDLFTGQITAIEPAVNPATRNVTVQASFDNADHRLRPGMFARVSVDLGESREVLVIPKTAVSFNPYGNAVFLISGTGDDAGEETLKVTRRFIKTGESRGDFVTVEQGLAPDDRVAASGLLRLRNGATVIINNDVGPEAMLDPRPANN